MASLTEIRGEGAGFAQVCGGHVEPISLVGMAIDSFNVLVFGPVQERVKRMPRHLNGVQVRLRWPSIIYENVTDSTQTVILLTFGVFGLIKLTSEDNNAIRNTLLGITVLRKHDQVLHLLKYCTQSECKDKHATSGEDFSCLNEKRCCNTAGQDMSAHFEFK